MVWNCLDDFQPSEWFETVWMVLKLSGIIWWKKLHVSAESWKQEYGITTLTYWADVWHRFCPTGASTLPMMGKHRAPVGQAACPFNPNRSLGWSRSMENMVYANQQQYYYAITANSNAADSGPFIDFMLGEIKNRAWTQRLLKEQVQGKAAGVRRRPSRTPNRWHRCLRHALHRLREVLTARFIPNCDWWSKIIHKKNTIF